ncbi:hypothetical protein GCM10022292_10750 [Winogradskyella damuponensis]|uniref:Uncharacterized protein n=1 Tax=Winogradskyella damuponensis TaxID=943939 RepID=A0ABP8CQ91_9FLAO
MVIVTSGIGSEDVASFTLPLIMVLCAIIVKEEKIPNNKIIKLFFIPNFKVINLCTLNKSYLRRANLHYL